MKCLFAIDAIAAVNRADRARFDGISFILDIASDPAIRGPHYPKGGSPPAWPPALEREDLKVQWQLSRTTMASALRRGQSAQRPPGGSLRQLDGFLARHSGE